MVNTHSLTHSHALEFERILALADFGCHIKYCVDRSVEPVVIMEDCMNYL